MARTASGTYERLIILSWGAIHAVDARRVRGATMVVIAGVMQLYAHWDAGA